MSEDAEALLTVKERNDDRNSWEAREARQENVKAFAKSKWLLYALVASVVANLALGGYAVIHNILQNRSHLTKAPTRLIEQQFPPTSEYGESTNFTNLDILWDEFSVYLNQGFVALDDPELPPADNFPWDPTKQVYALNSFHLLHCLHIIYTSIRSLQTAEPSDAVELGHTMHCLGALKEEIKCKADDNLIPLADDLFKETKTHPQVRTCRDWQQLEKFATENSACFKDLTGQPGHLTVDEWRNCPKDSPYRQIADEYQPV